MKKYDNASKVRQTIHGLKHFFTRNPMVVSDWADSYWFKSYDGSKIAKMAEPLKMGVPHPNDIIFGGKRLLPQKISKKEKPKNIRYSSL